MGKVLYDDKELIFDDELSFKDLSRKNLKKLDLNGKVIYASCFSHETPDYHIFPEDMTGVSFYNCNLDNCYIPPGNTVIRGSQRRFLVQKDSRDWEVDNDNKPTKVLNEKYWKQQGLSVDPKDIPEMVYNAQTISRGEYDKYYGKGNYPPICLFIKIPVIVQSKITRQTMIVRTSALPDLKNVVDITEKYIKPGQQLVGMRVVKADVEMVDIVGEASMYDDLSRIKKAEVV